MSPIETALLGSAAANVRADLHHPIEPERPGFEMATARLLGPDTLTPLSSKGLANHFHSASTKHRAP